MTGIYKIENLINHKIYIGQSIHIYRRWREHCYSNTGSIIHKAIQKYGQKNFSFEIIEECSVEKLNERELYYINYYNSIVPNGYNIADAGNENVNIYYHYDKELFLQIKNDIKNSNLSFQEISEKYNLSLRNIYYLNRGEVHKEDNENYPLRPVQDFSKQEHFCCECGALITKGAARCRKCANLVQRITKRPTREQLKSMIKEESFVSIGKKYNVSDNTVRKWCESMLLPRTKTAIKKYSDEEWEKI